MNSLLVIGGARSGKSRYAQARAEASGLKPVYMATAQARDHEMRERIARHRADRDARWATLEVPLQIAEAIAQHARPDTIMLIDCLTLWATNLILGEHDVAAAVATLIDALSAAQGPLIMVTNEVGYGIVPGNPLARRFRDEAGLINQRIAAAVSEMQLIVAGIPLRLK